jgi:hypothetical protein
LAEVGDVKEAIADVEADAPSAGTSSHVCFGRAESRSRKRQGAHLI